MSRRNGFTIVEVVAIVAITASLLWFLLPSLKSSRETARHTLCQAQTRSASQLILSACVDNQDAWPNAGEERHEVLMPNGEPVFMGGTHGLSNGRWALMFPDHWRGGDWDRALQCPRQPRPGDGPFPTTLPMLWMSGAMWLDPISIEQDHEERARWARTRVADVLFPSHKTLLFEQAAFCVEAPEAQPWLRMAQTPYWPVSVTLVDGSARRATRSLGMPAAWTLPFDVTMQGVRGRDLRD